MIYYTPQLKIVDASTEIPAFSEKLGGLPWGFPVEKWPHCAECGVAMNHVCSLRHDPYRLDLGKEGRIVYVFMCNHEASGCDSWSSESGANAVCFLEESELCSGLTQSPNENQEDGIFSEVQILGWEEKEDGVHEDDYPKYFSNESFGELTMRENETQPVNGFKLGGVPAWVQGAEEGPRLPFRFVAQFEDYFESVDVANYGTGRAYLFVLPDAEKPKGAFFWQC